ncbi:hypothetical protein [Streptomyces naganishii]|uniref:Secreted protein n=1 Tax=Streptomyces naganishii JCM 4654 TaxID=1306179 RepID=A0A918Y4R9_9ACTN|nr:hypothetical protein [Streptomyces naganishii]GHD90027.1 hypothetical protein GCM10010508_33110 [Streptomyces naganishii JCM 4654]
MHAPRRTRTLLTALAVTAALAATTGVATADSTPAPAASAAAKHSGDGAKALCRRVPKLDRRIDRALKRLDAGAGTRGSISRLEKRVDNAKKAGHTEIATYLQDRLDFRKSLRNNLEKRHKDLAAVKTWCAANGDGKAAG